MTSLPGKTPPPPLGLVVFLENLGRFGGSKWPAWVAAAVDFVSEEYVKLALRLYGVYRRYDRVVILEDARATGPDLRAALVALSRTHRVDLLILAHGEPETIIGYKGLRIPAASFRPLLDAYRSDPALLNLHVVWQMNCYGASLVQMWRDLGAQAVNGSAGVNWMPEPTLTLFLRRWLRGEPFARAVAESSRRAEAVWRPVYRPGSDRATHPRVLSSRPVIAGRDAAIQDS